MLVAAGRKYCGNAVPVKVAVADNTIVIMIIQIMPNEHAVLSCYQLHQVIIALLSSFHLGKRGNHHAIGVAHTADISGTRRHVLDQSSSLRFRQGSNILCLLIQPQLMHDFALLSHAQIGKVPGAIQLMLGDIANRHFGHGMHAAFADQPRIKMILTIMNHDLAIADGNLTIAIFIIHLRKVFVHLGSSHGRVMIKQTVLRHDLAGIAQSVIIISAIIGIVGIAVRLTCRLKNVLISGPIQIVNRNSIDAVRKRHAVHEHEQREQQSGQSGRFIHLYSSSSNLSFCFIQR